MPESLKGEQMAKPKRGSLTDAMDRMERARAATESAPSVPVEPAPPSPETNRERFERLAEGSPKAKISLYLDRAMVEQARGAVAWAIMQGGEPESISALMNAALAAELDRLRGVLKPEGGEFPSLTRGRKGRPPRA
jgi:hypothetical protein